MAEAVIAAIAAVFGGAGLKLVESLVNKSKVKVDVATQIRDELRVEIGSLRKELKSAETRLDKTRDMYYAVLHAFNLAKTKMISAGMLDDVREVEQFLKSRAPEDTIPE